MAVEAHNLNLFPKQVFSSREPMANNGGEGNGNVFETPIEYRVMAPLMFGSVAQSKIAVGKSESRLIPISRKRSREMINPPLVQNQISENRCSSFRFLGEDISYEIQQQQLQIDRFISQHMEKVRMEVEQRRQRYFHKLVTVLEENIMKKVKSKDEEIEKICKLKWVLEERVKSLSVENQICRDLAQTNEAMVNALRCNLEQVLAQVNDEPAAIVDDAQSYWGSNFDEIDGRMIADHASGSAGDGSYRINRTCRSCWREESCVLLLPCRHLCLCTVCGSTLLTCPVCKSAKTASVHVNLSS